MKRRRRYSRRQLAEAARLAPVIEVSLDPPCSKCNWSEKVKGSHRVCRAPGLTIPTSPAGNPWFCVTVRVSPRLGCGPQGKLFEKRWSRWKRLRLWWWKKREVRRMMDEIEGIE